MRLLEVPRVDTRTKHEPSLVRDVLAGEQAEEMALAGAVVAEQRNAFTKRHLEVERKHQSRDLELVTREHAHAGTSTAQPDPDVLAARSLRRRSRFLELPKSRHGRLQAA